MSMDVNGSVQCIVATYTLTCGFNKLQHITLIVLHVVPQRGVVEVRMYSTLQLGRLRAVESSSHGVLQGLLAAE